MFTINYKAKSTNDTEIIKIEMIFYRPNYARLSRILNITGKKNEWDDKTQLFVENSSSNIEKNKKLRDEKLKFIKVAEDWEAESIEFSPKQWADYFKTTRPSSTAIKIISVSNMLDEIIERKRTRKRLINNFEVTSKGSAKYYATLKRHLGEFTTSAYNKALSTYYFTDLNSQFVEDFLFFLKKKAKENNAPSVPRAYLTVLYGLVYYANEKKLPGSDLSIFATTKNQIQKNETEPQTISIEVMKKIENLDRSLLTKNECEYLDYYLFCFYAGGMPPINASYLEWTNIDEKCILRYNRFKTGKKAEVPFIKKAFDIAEKYSSKCFNHFVLPIYSHKQISEDQKIMKLKRVSIHVNRTLTKVAELIGYDGKITWYSARGTFITYMVKKGYNAFDIAKMCGNSVMAIERSYFKQTDHKNILDEMNASF